MTTTTLSRRLVLLAAATAPASISNALPALAGGSAVDALWLERLELLNAIAAVERQYSAAHATLPAWAQEGPERIDSNGNRVGQIVGAPEIPDPQPPTDYPNATRVIRPSLTTIRDDFEQWCAVFCDRRSDELLAKSRAKARVTYRKRVRALLARLREREQLKEAANIPALTRELERLCALLFTAEGRIKSLAESGDMNAGAAELIVNATYQNFHDDPLEDTQRLVLASMRRALSGHVAKAVADLLDNPDKPLAEFPFVVATA